MGLPPHDAGAALLLILGFLLMAVEALIPSFGLFGIGGIAAFCLAALLFIEPASAPWTSIGWDAVLLLAVATLLFASLVGVLGIRAYRRESITGPAGMIGDEAEIIEWTGDAGRVRIQGEIWSATSGEVFDARPGDKVIVSQVNGLNLKIRPC